MTVPPLVIHRGAPRRPPRGQGLPRGVWLSGVGVLVAGLLAFGLYIVRAATVPLDPLAGTERFVVEPGEPATRVLDNLEAQHLIRDGGVLLWVGLLSGQVRRLQPGTYELSAALPPREILRRLAAGEVLTVTVTIPEGFTLRQIARVLEEQEITDGDALLRLALHDGSRFPTLFPHPGASLEGYLFPDTYEFAIGTRPAAVIERMLARFAEAAWPELDSHVQEFSSDAADAAPRDARAVVILASLVEGEAKLAAERARIAGVLLNRLRAGRLLECDATVQYALPERKPRLFLDDLQIDSPYNTYRYPGLPPGPINSPGLAALHAALEPEQTPYQYYVARRDGGHFFSRTLAEHEQAVRRARNEGTSQP